MDNGIFKYILRISFGSGNQAEVKEDWEQPNDCHSVPSHHGAEAKGR